MSVAINAPKTPVTAGSKGLAMATIPNVCKMPGPPAPFVPTPLPNLGKSGSSPQGYSTTVTIAVPNNNDLIEMKKLSPVFEKANPDIQLKWIVLEENVLRQRLTTDITTNGGQFDVAAIGTYEAPLWGKRGWLVPVTGLPASYDLDDVLKSVRDGLSYHGTLYALPFNAESSTTFYRKDLFAAASTKTCRS